MSPIDEGKDASIAVPDRPDSAKARRVRRILIVDHHPLVRQGLHDLMSNAEDLAICGEAETLHQAPAALVELEPDALLCEIGLSQVDGVDLLGAVRARHPRLPILVLSHRDETLYAERMLSLGANGYIMKDASAEELLRALRRVLDGQPYVSESISNHIVHRSIGKRRTAAEDPMSRLSAREVQILRMIGRGLSTREIALALHLSIKTIESHRQRIRGKLNLRSAIQLLRFAMADRSLI